MRSVVLQKGKSRSKKEQTSLRILLLPVSKGHRQAMHVVVAGEESGNGFVPSRLELGRLPHHRLWRQLIAFGWGKGCPRSNREWECEGSLRSCKHLKNKAAPRNKVSLTCCEETNTS